MPPHLLMRYRCSIELNVFEDVQDQLAVAPVIGKFVVKPVAPHARVFSFFGFVNGKEDVAGKAVAKTF